MTTVPTNPTVKSLEFFCPGVPQPQGSARAFVRGGRAVVTSANARLRPWRAAVTAAAAEAHRDAPPFDVPVFVTAEFTFPRPAGHFGKRGLLPSAPEWPAVRPDLDKLTRALLDSLTDAGVIRGDALVVRLAVDKHYDDRPGVCVAVGPAWPPIRKEVA